MNRSKENTWCQLNNKPLLRPVDEVIERLKTFVDTYMNQPGVEDYDDNLIITDMLYGLGEALDVKYKWADGFDEFKKRLYEQLKAEGIDHDKIS